MAQNLIEITPEALELQLYKMSNSQLKSIIVAVYQWKKDNQDKLNPENINDLSIIMDIERKETKINKELIRRGYLSKKDYNDFFKWMKTLNKGKKVF